MDATSDPKSDLVMIQNSWIKTAEGSSLKEKRHREETYTLNTWLEQNRPSTFGLDYQKTEV